MGVIKVFRSNRFNRFNQCRVGVWIFIANDRVAVSIGCVLIIRAIIGQVVVRVVVCVTIAVGYWVGLYNRGIFREWIVVSIPECQPR